VLERLTHQLEQAQSLSPEQIRAAVAHLAQETIPLETKAAFLTALARKGETIDEIAGFARELVDKSIQPPVDAQTRAGVIIDVCGAGGDYLGTFNVSTTVALVVAAAGVTVAKHGNRAVTSKCGSADVIETLGLRIDATPEQAARSLREHQFAFFFAPQYHPAFKHIVPVRRLCAARGQRTIFNFLGPLLNPARPSVQLIGLPQPGLCEPIARVLQSLGARRGMVVSGKIEPSKIRAAKSAGSAAPATALYLDELSVLGENTIAEFYQDRGFAVSTMPTEGFPLQPATLEDLSGGDREANAEIIRRLLRGEDRGPRRDTVLLNAAAALLVAGEVKSLDAGWPLAEEVLEDGRAWAKLNELVAAKC
jgi:anthranilate phosphoribosyltransferase